MNFTADEIIAKASASSDLADKLMAATTKAEVLQALRGIGIEVSEATPESSQPLADGQLAGIAGGAARISLADFIRSVHDSHIAKAAPHLRADMIERRDKVAREMESLNTPVIRNVI